MSDKVIDLEAARKRLRSPEPESLDYDEEIAWAEEEMDAVEEEIVTSRDVELEEQVEIFV